MQSKLCILSLLRLIHRGEEIEMNQSDLILLKKEMDAYLIGASRCLWEVYEELGGRQEVYKLKDGIEFISEFEIENVWDFLSSSEMLLLTDALCELLCILDKVDMDLGMEKGVI